METTFRHPGYLVTTIASKADYTAWRWKCKTCATAIISRDAVCLPTILWKRCCPQRYRRITSLHHGVWGGDLWKTESVSFYSHQAVCKASVGETIHTPFSSQSLIITVGNLTIRSWTRIVFIENEFPPPYLATEMILPESDKRPYVRHPPIAPWWVVACIVRLYSKSPVIRSRDQGTSIWNTRCNRSRRLLAVICTESPTGDWLWLRMPARYSPKEFGIVDCKVTILHLETSFVVSFGIARLMKNSTFFTYWKTYFAVALRNTVYADVATEHMVDKFLHATSDLSDVQILADARILHRHPQQVYILNFDVVQ